MPTVIEIANENASHLSQEFLEWLPNNLHVWEAFQHEAFRVIARGFRHYSSKTILEFLRHYTLTTEASGEWKLNNNYTAYLSRLFGDVNPEHALFFNYRETKKPKGDQDGIA